MRQAPGGRNVATGTVIGHPAHPLLVSAPIGAWTSAGLLDLTGRSPAAARRLVGAGVLLAIPTVLTGVGDWLDTSGPEQEVGALHAAANLVATSGYAWSWWLRRRHPAAGVAAGGAAAAVATAAGWLGGHLVYSMGVGVDTNAFRSGPTDWTDLGVRPNPGGEPQLAEVGGTRLVAAGLDGTTAVLADRCSHRGGPLSEGSVSGGCVTCPWHGSRFDLRTGEVRVGPASAPQPTFEVREGPDGLQVRRPEQRSLRTNPV